MFHKKFILLLLLLLPVPISNLFVLVFGFFVIGQEAYIANIGGPRHVHEKENFKRVEA